MLLLNSYIKYANCLTISLLQFQVNQNQERLKAVLTDEQKELLEKLLTASEEFANLIELDCFKVGFKLGTRFTIEAYT